MPGGLGQCASLAALQELAAALGQLQGVSHHVAGARRGSDLDLDQALGEAVRQPAADQTTACSVPRSQNELTLRVGCQEATQPGQAHRCGGTGVGAVRQWMR